MMGAHLAVGRIGDVLGLHLSTPLGEATILEVLISVGRDLQRVPQLHLLPRRQPGKPRGTLINRGG